jgi:hypothetical protein
MSYRVKADAAVIFMKTFYRAFFSGEDIFESAAAGRRALREDRRRVGKLALELDCEDDYVPICYFSVPPSPKIRDTTMSAPPSAAQTIGSSTYKSNSPYDQSMTGAHKIPGLGSSPSISYDADLLALETILAEWPVVILHGEPGTGKTQLCRSIGQWWERTGYASQVKYYGLLSSGVESVEPMIRNLIQDLERIEMPSISGLQIGGQPVAVSTIESSLSDLETIYLVDDLERWVSFESSNAISENEIQTAVSNFSAKFDRYARRSRIILISGLPPSQLKNRFPSAFLCPKSTPSDEEMALIANGSSYASKTERRPLSNHDAECLGEIARRHSNNLLFMSLFQSQFARLGVPPEKLLEQFRDDFTLSDFKELNIRNESSISNIVTAFGGIVESFGTDESNGRLKFLLLMSLAPFQQRFDSEFGDWAFILFQAGYLREDGKPHCHSGIDFKERTVSARESGFFRRIRSAWAEVQQKLEALGLLEVRPSGISHGTRNYLKLHPILPYLLRNTMAFPRDSVQVAALYRQRIDYCLLEKCFQQYYDQRVVEASTKNGESSTNDTGPSQAWFLDDLRFNEHLNIQESVRLSINIGSIPFKPPPSYFVVDAKLLGRLQTPQLRMWDSILKRVIDRFELVYTRQEWAATAITDQGFTKSSQEAMVFSMLTIALARAQILRALHGQAGGIDNVNRALALTSKLSSAGNFRLTTDTEVLAFDLACRRAYILLDEDDNNPTNLPIVRELLLRDFPEIEMEPESVRYYRSSKRFLALRAAACGKESLQTHQIYDLVVKEISRESFSIAGAPDVNIVNGFDPHLVFSEELSRVLSESFPWDTPEKVSTIAQAVETYQQQYSSLDTSAIHPLSRGFQSLDPSRFIESLDQINKGKGVELHRKDVLETAYFDALRRADVGNQYRILTQLFDMAWRIEDFAVMETYHSELVKLQGPADSETAIRRASRLLSIVSCIYRFATGLNSKASDSSEAPVEIDSLLFRAAKYAREVEDELEYETNPKATVFYAESLHANFRLASLRHKLDKDHEFRDEQLYLALWYMVTLSRLEFSDDKTYIFESWAGPRMLSWLLDVWGRLDDVPRRKLEKIVAGLVRWREECLERALKQMQKMREELGEGHPEVDQLLGEGKQILLHPRANEQSYRFWSQYPDGCWNLEVLERDNKLD